MVTRFPNAQRLHFCIPQYTIFDLLLKMRTGNMSDVRALAITITAWMAHSVVNTTLWKTTEFGETIIILISLQWRHNGRDGISNHQPHDYLLAVDSGAYQRKHQRSASLAFVRGIHRWPVNSPHKGLVTRKMFPFDDVIMFFERVANSTLLWDVCKNHHRL